MNYNHDSVILFKVYTYLFVIILSSCNASNISLFSSTKPGDFSALTISDLSSLSNYYNISEQIQLVSGIGVSSISDSYNRSNNLSVKSTYNFPTVNFSEDIYSLSFTQGASQAVVASGVLPEELYQQMTIFSVLSISSSGTILSYGSDETNELLEVSVSGTSLVLNHQTSTDNYRKRIYDISSFFNKKTIYTFSFGADGKDIELYINGFRITQYSSINNGGISSYSRLQRNLTVGGVSHGTFKIYDLSLIGDKFGPQKIYQVSKYFSKKWNISISTSLTKEIRLDSIPSIEPEIINYSFIAGAILTPKCTGCHRDGGTLPYLDSYTNVLTGSTVDGPVVVLGSASTSRLYIRTAATTNYMPSGGGAHLTETELDYIKQWIDSGAPN